MSHAFTRIAALAALIGLGAAPATAQMSASDLVVRIDQLENQVRQLTGTVEQLQFRNQQLESQLKRMQEDTDFRFQDLAKGGARTAPPARSGAASAPPPPPPSPTLGAAPVAAPPPPPASTGRRSDVFDPTLNPNAPGAPRPLGGGPPLAASVPPAIVQDQPAVGVPGGREAGAPLDLSTMAGGAGAAATAGRPAADGAQVAALHTPREEFDLAYGYLLAKDYARAEAGLHAFMTRYPSDALAPEAQFWIGESLYQRQSYRNAADAFLNMTKKYEGHPKAPDALLRLGQSLAALKEKELACATFGEVGRKYPRASASVKQAVEREQKRVHC